MKRLLIIIAGLFSIAYGQRYQTMPAEGYGPIKRMRVDSVLNIPIGDTTRKRNLSDGKDSGQIRWFNGSLYVYNGAYWSDASGGGSGITRTELQDTAAALRAADQQTLQMVIDRSNTTTTVIESQIQSGDVGYQLWDADNGFYRVVISNGTTAVAVRDGSGNYFGLEQDGLRKLITDSLTSYKYSFPNKAGTVALTSDITSTDTTSLSNRIDAKASLSGAAFTGPVSITTTSGGLLIPRMTTTQRDAISSPATNLIVNNTTTTTIDQYSGSSWYSIAGDVDIFLRAAQAMGSPIKAGPLYHISQLNTGTALTSTRSYFNAVYVDKPITITGAAFYQTTQGNFTESNYNGIALYSYSGGTVTLVDSTARNGNIWKGTSGTWQQAAFAGGSRTLQPGLYYLLFLYSSSAQTTAPVVGNTTAGTGNYLAPLTTNSARFYGGVVTSVTSPPTSQACSAWTNITTYYGAFLY